MVDVVAQNRWAVCPILRLVPAYIPTGERAARTRPNGLVEAQGGENANHHRPRGTLCGIAHKKPLARLHATQENGIVTRVCVEKLSDTKRNTVSMHRQTRTL